MIRRNTWILLLLLAGLLAYTLYYNNKKALTAMEDLAPTAETTALFAVEEGQPSSIKVVAATGESVELAWDAQGQWVLKSPEPAAAEQGLAEAAASQVSTLRVLDQIDLGPAVIGLVQPAYVISLGFSGGTNHSLEVGDKTPSQSGYYVRVDGGETVIISAAGLDSLISLLEFPPYAATPTPPPATATPAPSATP